VNGRPGPDWFRYHRRDTRRRRRPAGGRRPPAGTPPPHRAGGAQQPAVGLFRGAAHTGRGGRNEDRAFRAARCPGGAAGIGGGGSVASGIFGGLLGAALNKAHMALDIRIVDTSTSEILAATRVQGQASDVAGGLMTGFLGSWGLGGGLSMYANTPMEKAIRICIIEAVKYISQSIPASYYKY